MFRVTSSSLLYVPAAYNDNIVLSRARLIFFLLSRAYKLFYCHRYLIKLV